MTDDDAINVPLTMRDLAVLKESLDRTDEALGTALKPFGLNTTWDAQDRLRDVRHKVTEARCDLKRRHPQYNPVGDPECRDWATDEELDRWAVEHPEEDPQ